jgi:hypothetical protein
LYAVALMKRVNQAWGVPKMQIRLLTSPGGHHQGTDKSGTETEFNQSWREDVVHAQVVLLRFFESKPTICHVWKALFLGTFLGMF